MSLFYTKQQIRTTATPFFNATVNNIRNIIDNPDGVQWVIYSAHDTTVGNMLAALNFTNPECIYEAFKKNLTTNTDTCIIKYPIYASTLHFELNKLTAPNKTAYYTIKIRYNGEYRRIPFCGGAVGGDKECNVEKFFAWFDGWKDTAFDKTCGIKDTQSETYFTMAILELAVILVIILAALIAYLKKNAIPQASVPKKEVKMENEPH